MKLKFSHGAIHKASGQKVGKTICFREGVGCRVIFLLSRQEDYVEGVWESK